MRTLPISKLSDFLYHIAFRNRRSVMVWGEPGIGKTVAIEDFNQRIGGFLCGERFGQIESVDARGLPDTKEGRTTWCAPETWPFKCNADKFPSDRPIVFFADEINGATSQGMFAVAMQAFNERKVGPHEFMDNVIMIAAGNREQDRAIAQKMPTTNANRFTHVEAGRDVDGWCFRMQEIYGPKVAALPIAFYQFRKDLLYTFDPAKADKAFSTGRTAEVAWNYYADPDIPNDIKSIAMAGTIGEGPAVEAEAFIDVWSKVIPIERIIKDPKGCEVPEEPSMQYALTVNISGNLDKKNVEPLTTYLLRMTPEFGVLAWQLAIKRDKSLYTTKEYLGFAKKYRTVFTGA
jgi:hypothetical protein